MLEEVTFQLKILIMPLHVANLIERGRERHTQTDKERGKP